MDKIIEVLGLFTSYAVRAQWTSALVNLVTLAIFTAILIGVFLAIKSWLSKQGNGEFYFLVVLVFLFWCVIIATILPGNLHRLLNPEYYAITDMVTLITGAR